MLFIIWLWNALLQVVKSQHYILWPSSWRPLQVCNEAWRDPNMGDKSSNCSRRWFSYWLKSTFLFYRTRLRFLAMDFFFFTNQTASVFSNECQSSLCHVIYLIIAFRVRTYHHTYHKIKKQKQSAAQISSGTLLPTWYFRRWSETGKTTF